MIITIIRSSFVRRTSQGWLPSSTARQASSIPLSVTVIGVYTVNHITFSGGPGTPAGRPCVANLNLLSRQTSRLEGYDFSRRRFKPACHVGVAE